MDTSIIILLISFFGFIFMGVPIAISISISSLLTMFFIVPADLVLQTAAANIANGVNSFTLLAIPFFIFSGNIMNRGGLADKLINFVKLFIGRLPGALYYVNILTNMLFGALSGSAAAAAAAVGKTLDPLQKKENYDIPLATAVNAASCPAGLLIPPSNTLILYSLVSGGTSVSALFMAGYIPGILMGLTVAVVTFIINNKPQNDEHLNVPKKTFKEVIKIIVDAIPSLFLIVIIIGGIGLGIFTATEASAVAVIYSLLLSFYYRSINMEIFIQIIKETVNLCGMILLLIAVSGMLSWVLSFSGIPAKFAEVILSITDNKIAILLLINVILLIAGMFLDMSAAVLIFTPILLPIAKVIGVDVIHFGIIMTFNLCIGLITPPVGSALFIASSVSSSNISEVIKKSIPITAALVITLLIVTYIPNLSLYLPKLLGLVQ